MTEEAGAEGLFQQFHNGPAVLFTASYKDSRALVFLDAIEAVVDCEGIATEIFVNARSIRVRETYDEVMKAISGGPYRLAPPAGDTQPLLI